MIKRLVLGFLAVLLVVSCSPTKTTPVYLRIDKPSNGDTLHVTSIPVSGKTSVGASVTLGSAAGVVDFTATVDDTGHFTGTYSIPGQTGEYSIFFTAKLGGLSVTESRSFYYVN